MNEIQNQISLYQYLKNIFLCISIFCLLVAFWLYCRWKRNRNLKMFFFLFLIVESFISLQQVQAFSFQERPVVLKMKEGTRLKYTKIYDRDDFRVFHNLETGDILENLEDIEIEGVEKSDEVFVKVLEGVTEKQVKDAVEKKETVIFLTKVELGGKDALKYKVDFHKGETCLDGEITIKKRKINLKAEGGQREYGHYNEIKYNTDMPVQENKESYVNRETEGLLEGDIVSYPIPYEKKIEEDRLPDYPPGEWKDRITVKHNGKPGKNYYFNYEEVACGSLEIQQETIENPLKYIAFETDREQVYFDKKAGKLWAAGEMKDFRVLLKENEKTGLYTDVCTETGEIISQNGKGLDFSKENFKEGEEYKIPLYLIHKKNKVKSNPFEISVFLDTGAPEVTENTIGDRIYDVETLPDIISFCKFYGKEETGKERFYIEDKEGCGIKTSWYHVMEGEDTFTKEMVLDYFAKELKKEKWNLLPESGEVQLPQEEKNYLVFIKTQDYLGHEQISISNGIMTDWKDPRLQIGFGELQQVSETGIYGEDIKLLIQCEDTEGKYRSSGLKEIYYTISNGKKEKRISLFHEKEEISIPVQEYGDGEIKVQAFAEDRAGNIGKSKAVKLNIDVTNPEISVRWSMGRPNEEMYYNAQRTAQIEITEKNFNSALIKWEIQGKAQIGKWKTKGQTHFCEVTFSKDGVYGLAFSCEDKAGNQEKYEEQKTFIIDRTSPIVEVSYENETASDIKYFNRVRVAEIVIHEQNFDKNQVKISAKEENSTGETPEITDFSSHNGIHKAKVSYEDSGEYYLQVSCIDKAGNQAEDFQSEHFYLDLEIPEIKIFNMKDKSSNKGEVAPIVEIKDLNYQQGGFAVDITGSNEKSLKIKKTVKQTEQGQKIYIADLPRTEEIDDIYTLSVAAVDKAGNWAKEEIVFSVNRYGSIYERDFNTGKWLSMDEKNHTYLKEGREVGIYEYNIDAIKERTLTVNCDGELKDLKEGQDYTVKTLEKEGKWKKNHYKIKAENFKTEGNYTIILNSKDNADNSMNNTSMKRKTEVLPLSFTVDRTSPTIFISGIEDEGKYQSAVKEILIEAADNLALQGVDVQIGNRKIHYGKEELKERNGIIKEQISKDENWQKIQISAIDAAKNKAQKNLRVLVMTSPLKKEKAENNTTLITLTFLLITLLFIWKKKQGCFILKQNKDKREGK